MVTNSEIRDFCDQMVNVYGPRRIILFGSYASGLANEDSDVDLLVEMQHEGLGLRKAAEMIRQLKPCFPVDLIVRRPDEVARRLVLNDFFLQAITSKGTVLYDATHA